MSEESLIELARDNGITTLVLTDINNTSACLNVVRLLKNDPIKPVIGIDFRNDHQQLYVGIAQNNAGFQELNKFLSEHLHYKKPLPERAPQFRNAFIIYPLEQALLLNISRFRESEYLGISTTTLRKLPFTRFIEQPEKLVVLQTVTFRNKRDYNIHRLLRCIDLNLLLSKLPVEQQGNEQDRMLPVSELKEAFKEYPVLIENTQQLLEQCSIDFNFDNAQLNENQQVFTNSQQEDEELLRSLAYQGITTRYADKENLDIVRQRIEKELAVVHKKGFTAYFLINWEICRYARERGYFYVGRGSGANSILAYLLFITEVDPIELDLYFERFINDYRSSPPDFDIDFSWDDREDITRYIFERFTNVALLATYNTFQIRAVIRELGKVFGIPKMDIDRMTSGHSSEVQMGEMHQLVLKYSQLIEGMPNYISIHAGGILITQRDIHYYSATLLPPKGYPTVQFDMHIAEDAGIHKFDILAQRGLGKIRDTLHIINYNQPATPLADLRNDVKKFMKDPAINSMIAQAKCVGCFYIESPAMRMLLTKLRTSDYLGLVAASSVIRPGVAQSGMMREFILRTRYPHKREEAHPIMAQIMPDTYGIMVYQEDVIKVAHHYANLDLGQADILRRGMSGKYRSREEFKMVEDTYFKNCKQLGHDPKESKEIWEQIKSFAGYAFAKGHSASYAVESYQSLYLKCYFPLEYLTATLNNGGGFYTPEIYIHEAKMCGATIEPPCINHSDLATIIKERTIYLSFAYIKELEKRTIMRIVEDRDHNGIYNSLGEFMDRVPIGIEQLSVLIRIDAFRSTGKDRYELLWFAHSKWGKKKNQVPQKSLFPTTGNFSIPQLVTTDLEQAFEQIELLGFPLCSHFDLLKEPIPQKIGAQDLPFYKNKKVQIHGYIVNIKSTSTSNGKRMQFGTFLDHRGDFFDVVLFPPVVARVRFRGSGIYEITGKVVEEFEFYSIEVHHLIKKDYIQDPRYADANPQTARKQGQQESLKNRRLESLQRRRQNLL